MRRRLLALALLGVVCLTACGGKGKPSQETEPETLIEETAAVFDGGETASLWQRAWFGQKVYRLSDGTELMTLDEPLEISHINVGGMTGYDGLSEKAQTAVLAYFEEQGLLIDPEEELRRAYEDYRLARTEDRAFRSHFLRQENSPYGENEDYLCCITTVMHPLELRYDGTADEDRYGVVFDRRTGEIVPVWELFRVPEAEARAALVDETMRYYKGDRAHVERALEERHILWSESGVEVDFPRGTLPGEEHDWQMHIDLEDLEELLTDKALAFPEKD